jgi:CRP-like cAMP-binding protein
VTELPLFAEPARARTTDPDTSQAAADSLTPMGVESRCRELYTLIAGFPRSGLTCADLVKITNYDRGNTSRRLTDLKHTGWIRDSGRRRPGPTGQPNIVWVVTDKDPAA